MRSLFEESTLPTEDHPTLEFLEKYGPQESTPDFTTPTLHSAAVETFAKTIEKINQYESRARFSTPQKTPLQFFEKKTPSRKSEADETF